MANDTTLLQPKNNCAQFSELITAFADGELLPNEQEQLEAHLQSCNNCTRMYELEIATKQFLSSSLPPLKTPWKVRADIIDKIRIESGMKTQERPSFFFPWWKPTLAIGGAFAIVLLSFLFFFNKQQQIIAINNSAQKNGTGEKKISSSSPLASSDGKQITQQKKEKRSRRVQSNVLDESLSDFDLFLQGKKRPEKFSNRSEEVQQYLASNVNFPIRLPRMTDCKLVGCAVKQLGDDKIAQVVYSHRGQTVTLFQTPLSSLDNEIGSFFLPESIRTKLSDGSWYVDDSDPNCVMTFWINDGMLFYTAGAVEKEEFLKELSDGFQLVKTSK